MPLQEIHNVPAPPRSFTSRWQRWLYLFMSTRGRAALSAVGFASLLILPYAIYKVVDFNAYVAQLRPIGAEVVYLETVQEKEKYSKKTVYSYHHRYKVLFKDSKGAEHTVEMKTQRRLGCLRTDPDGAHSNCKPQLDTVLYSEYPLPSVVAEPPKYNPIILLILFAAAVLGLGLGFILTWRKKQRLIELLQTGLVAEGVQVNERIDNAHPEDSKTGKMLRREYEFTDFMDNKHRIIQNIRVAYANKLPEKIAILYPLKAPKEGIVLHEIAAEIYPQINPDGSMQVHNLVEKVVYFVGVFVLSLIIADSLFKSF